MIARIESPAKNYLQKVTDKEYHKKKIEDDLDSCYHIFHGKIETRNRNFNYYANKQWTDAEVRAHKQQFRHPYVFNEIQHKVDHLMGTQAQTRLDAKSVPREKGDEAAAELLNFMIKWAEQTNNLEYIESEVFLEAIVGGVGCALVRWEYEDINMGYPKVEKVPINEMYWDPNSKQMDLKDARWIARVMQMTRLEALEIFPNHEKIIEQATDIDGLSMSGTLRNVLNDRQRLVQNAKMQGYDSYRQILQIVEYYERVKVYQYVVSDEITGKLKKFDTEKEAKGYYNGLCDEYVSQGELLIDADGNGRVLMITNTTDRIFQTIMIGDIVAEYNDTYLPEPPYSFCFAYFNEGDYWGFVDSLIDPQRLVNVMFSQWDYQLGAANKNAVTLMETMLKKGFSSEDVRREFAKTAPVIPVLDHKAINALPNIPVNAELFQGINFGIQRMNDYAGGKNALGLQESAAESGRAIIARAEAGGMGRMPLFDKLRFWRRNITMKLVWYMKNFMTAGQILRVIGANDEVQYVELNDMIMNTLKEIKIDITIDEAVKSETMKERIFSQLKELLAMVPGMAPEVASNILIQHSSLSESKKQELLRQLEFYQGYMQQQAELMHEQKMQTQVEDSLRKKQIRESLEESDELQRTQRDLQKRTKDTQIELSKVQQLEMDLAEAGNDSIARGQIADRAKTPEEIRAVQNAAIT